MVAVGGLQDALVVLKRSLQLLCGGWSRGGVVCCSHGLNQGGVSGSGRIWTRIKYILKVDSTGHGEGCYSGDERGGNQE